jgi:hypothetical protein
MIKIARSIDRNGLYFSNILANNTCRFKTFQEYSSFILISIGIFIKSIFITNFVNYMVDNISNDSDGYEKVMKTFKSIENAMEDFRQISRNSFLVQFLSVEELYNTAIAAIDMLRRWRFSQDQMRFWRKLNKGMREVPPSYSNVGGLIPIKVKDNPEVYLSIEEKTFLLDVQTRLIRGRDALMENDLLTLLQLQLGSYQPVKSKSHRVQDPNLRHKNAGRRVRTR